MRGVNRSLDGIRVAGPERGQETVRMNGLDSQLPDRPTRKIPQIRSNDKRCASRHCRCHDMRIARIRHEDMRQLPLVTIVQSGRELALGHCGLGTGDHSAFWAEPCSGMLPFIQNAARPDRLEQALPCYVQ